MATIDRLENLASLNTASIVILEGKFGEFK